MRAVQWISHLFNLSLSSFFSFLVGIAGKTGMSEDGYELQFATNYLGYVSHCFSSVLLLFTSSSPSNFHLSCPYILTGHLC